MRCLTAHAETWPVSGRFSIARGSKIEAHVVVATIRDGAHVGRGECVPYARYGETVDGAIADIEAAAGGIAAGIGGADLLTAMHAGAARNALDAALWDLEAKQAGVRVWTLAGLSEPRNVTTAFTLSLGTPEAMGLAAAAEAGRPLLKVKLGATGDVERIAAVRRGAPHAALIVDANEGWTPETLPLYLKACRDAGVEWIEQPLPSDASDALATLSSEDRGGIVFCADESLHTRAELKSVSHLYQAINIKLDKTGGLTEALLLCAEARAQGLKIMVGCMVSTSLAMAPALLLAQHADAVDLDGPLLLARDRMPGLHFQGSTVEMPFPAELWG